MKYAFWVKGNRGEEFQVLGDNALNEWDILHGVAPPKPIKPEHENMSLHHLRGLYPCPPPSPIPKAKKQSD